MLMRTAFLLLVNYFLSIVALDEFDRTELHDRDKNNLETIGLKTFYTTLVSPLRRQSKFDQEAAWQLGSSPTSGSAADLEKHEGAPAASFDRLKRAPESSTFIVAGRQTNIDAYPWMAYISIVIRRVRESFCGGSLISSKHVVTAAHCLTFHFQSLNDIHVNLGEYDTRTYPRDCVYLYGEQKCISNVEMFPEKVTLHRMYDRGPLINDIALIRLHGSAPNSDYIRPIPLPPFDIDNPRNTGIQLSVAGWGSLYERGPVPAVKRDTVVNLVPFSECRTRTWIPEGKVCAIGQRGQDSCHGDSGGPLMAYYQGDYFLVGLVSGKELYAECGSKVPTTYVNVFKYLGWIKRNM